MPRVSMYPISKKYGNFGSQDSLACKFCDGEMQLTRRSPYPKLGPEYEEQRSEQNLLEIAFSKLTWLG